MIHYLIWRKGWQIDWTCLGDYIVFYSFRIILYKRLAIMYNLRPECIHCARYSLCFFLYKIIYYTTVMGWKFEIHPNNLETTCKIKMAYIKLITFPLYNNRRCWRVYFFENQLSLRLKQHVGACRKLLKKNKFGWFLWKNKSSFVNEKQKKTRYRKNTLYIKIAFTHVMFRLLFPSNTV